MDGTIPKRSFFKKILIWFLIILVSVVLLQVVAAILANIVKQDDVLTFRQNLSEIKPYFSAVRISVLINTILFWDRLIRFFSLKFQWSEERLEGMLSQRLKVAILLIFIELVFNQRIFDYLI